MRDSQVRAARAQRTPTPKAGILASAEQPIAVRRRTIAGQRWTDRKQATATHDGTGWTRALREDPGCLEVNEWKGDGEVMRSWAGGSGDGGKRKFEEGWEQSEGEMGAARS